MNSAAYKPFGKTVWKKKKPPFCLVESPNPPPEEIELKESLGRLHVKGTNPEFAANYYRSIKKLPEDWPLIVTVQSSDGKTISQGTFPQIVEVASVVNPLVVDQIPEETSVAVNENGPQP